LIRKVLGKTQGLFFFHGYPQFLKTLQILKERILVNFIKQEYTIQQANYYLERKAATAA
jgi:hypothetical protein